MNREQYLADKDAAYKFLRDMFKAMHEGRYDNTHTIHFVRAASAMHEAAFRELNLKHEERPVVVFDDPLTQAIEILAEMADEKPEVKERLTRIVFELEEMFDEGGDA